MLKKVSRIIFISLFFLMIAVPLVATFFQHEEVAVEQNRMLEPFPHFRNRHGRINPSFTMDFEAWINDHIGFRRVFVEQNGRFRYHVARGFSIDHPLFLGPGGELNYASFEAIRDYQHKNLYPESYLEKTAQSLQTMSDYAAQRGAEFFYYQCWDKHSIYPEYFPKEILQIGDESKTDGIIRVFREKTDVHVVSPKDELISAKSEYETYSAWGDPTHWTQRGAHIGYRKLMAEINANVPEPYRVLGEDDYKISWTDQGLTLFGNIHQEDLLERFEIKDPKAQQIELSQLIEKTTASSQTSTQPGEPQAETSQKAEEQQSKAAYMTDPRTLYFINPAAENGSRLVIIGDSYFYFYILDDLAESFGETIFIWGDHLTDFKEIVDELSPDLVIVENAEREDRTEAIINAAKKLQ